MQSGLDFIKLVRSADETMRQSKCRLRFTGDKRGKCKNAVSTQRSAAPAPARAALSKKISRACYTCCLSRNSSGTPEVLSEVRIA